ncbi:uncharacterized protein LOC123314302 [Coccinella septempunctata]|uniref:uncharacterized protein LOC123314302 n=1 Tax=Coccinella septempunctata TaxID=41139 RepID=UPI001D099DAC|nr:uncharacterized protein LOC123314302 [Coccinella septempunctata]
MIPDSVVLSVLVAFCISSAQGLNCYTCSTTSNEYDDNCVSTPTEDMTRDCNKKYCNIIRVEDKDPKNLVSSMSRGCSDAYLNGKTEDYTHIIYQMSCREDYCNSGSGKTASGGTHNYLGDKSTIYCPGTESSASTRLISIYTIIAFIAIFIM